MCLKKMYLAKEQEILAAMLALAQRKGYTKKKHVQSAHFGKNIKGLLFADYPLEGQGGIILGRLREKRYINKTMNNLVVFQLDVSLDAFEDQVAMADIIPFAKDSAQADPWKRIYKVGANSKKEPDPEYMELLRVRIQAMVDAVPAGTPIIAFGKPAHEALEYLGVEHVYAIHHSARKYSGCSRKESAAKRSAKSTARNRVYSQLRALLTIGENQREVDY
jgi:hypothetical protein